MQKGQDSAGLFKQMANDLSEDATKTRVCNRWSSLLNSSEKQKTVLLLVMRIESSGIKITIPDSDDAKGGIK